MSKFLMSEDLQVQEKINLRIVPAELSDLSVTIVLSEDSYHERRGIKLSLWFTSMYPDNITEVGGFT